MKIAEALLVEKVEIAQEGPTLEEEPVEDSAISEKVPQESTETLEQEQAVETRDGSGCH